MLSYFNTKFKQTVSWEQFHFPQKLTSLMMSSLLGMRLTLESWRRLTGLVKSTGVTTQRVSALTLYSKKPLLLSETSSLQRSLLGSGQATTAQDVKSKFSPSLKRYRPSARQSNWLDTEEPFIEPQVSTISRLQDKSKDTDEKTLHQSLN